MELVRGGVEGEVVHSGGPEHVGLLTRPWGADRFRFKSTLLLRVIVCESQKPKMVTT